jgi:hypothetical protein
MSLSSVGVSCDHAAAKPRASARNTSNSDNPAWHAKWIDLTKAPETLSEYIGGASPNPTPRKGERQMKPTSIAAIALTCVFAPTPSNAQTAKDLVGTWKNVSNTATSSGGKTSTTFGPNGTGMAIFAPDGRFVVVNINPDTPKFASNNRVNGTAEENKAAVAGGIGLFGTYKVSGKDVDMKVEGSTYPNWTGTDQKRHITKYTHDEFTWALTSSLGSPGEVTYRRVK